MSQYSLLIGLLGFGSGFAVAYWLKGQILSQKVRAAEEEALRILDDANRRSETLVKEAKLEAKDRLLKMKSEMDAEARETQSELKKQEKRLIQKEENIDRKVDLFERREREVADKEKELQELEVELGGAERKYNQLIEDQKTNLKKFPV